jgi:hypothetical protein
MRPVRLEVVHHIKREISMNTALELADAERLAVFTKKMHSLILAVRSDLPREYDESEDAWIDRVTEIVVRSLFLFMDEKNALLTKNALFNRAVAEGRVVVKDDSFLDKETGKRYRLGTRQ